MKRGAIDYLNKPAQMEERSSSEMRVTRPDCKRDYTAIPALLRHGWRVSRNAGSDSLIRKTGNRYADFVQREGETGKELVARDLHQASRLTDKPQLSLTARLYQNRCWKTNCSAAKKVRSLQNPVSLRWPTRARSSLIRLVRWRVRCKPNFCDTRGWLASSRRLVDGEFACADNPRIETYQMKWRQDGSVRACTVASMSLRSDGRRCSRETAIFDCWQGTPCPRCRNPDHDGEGLSHGTYCGDFRVSSC